MYFPFLWRIAIGQSLIIKRRWLRWSSKTLQIRSQRPKLIKHVHQKLTMSHLNGHDSLQHTMNVPVIRSRRWRNNSSIRIKVSIYILITWSRRRWRRRRRRCNTRRGRINSRAFKASSHLSWPLPKKGGTYGSNNMNRLKRWKLF